jgi:acetylornithine deacetylase
VGTVKGGEWHSTVPARVVAEGRFGVFPGESAAEARADLEAALARFAAADPFLADHPLRLEWIEGQFESGQTSLDHPLLLGLGQAHERALSRPVRLRGVTYGSDLRLFTNHAQMPAVLYGPGALKDAHAANESVAVSEVLACARSVALLALDWCGGRAG